MMKMMMLKFVEAVGQTTWKLLVLMTSDLWQLVQVGPTNWIEKRVNKCVLGLPLVFISDKNQV